MLEAVHAEVSDDLLGEAAGARALARQRLGCRYALDVVPLDPSVVRGTHGRLPDTWDDSPVLVCSDPSFGRDSIATTEAKGLLLQLSGLAKR